MRGLQRCVGACTRHCDSRTPCACCACTATPQRIRLRCCCSISPLCLDVPTLKAGVAEGRRCVLATCRAVLGDVLDFTKFEGE